MIPQPVLVIVLWILGGAPCAHANPIAGAFPEGYGEDGAWTPAGPLQGDWRVTRPGDPADAAVMRLQILHDGDELSGDFVLFQPFCWIERPLPQVVGDDCELSDLGGSFAEGQVRNGRARLVARPGAGGLDHVLSFTADAGDRLAGDYRPPGSLSPIPVLLERMAF